MQDENSIEYRVYSIQLGKEKIQNQRIEIVDSYSARCKMRAKKNTKTVCQSDDLPVEENTKKKYEI